MVKIIIYKHFYSYLVVVVVFLFLFFREGKNEENKEETKNKDWIVNHKWATEHTH